MFVALTLLIFSIPNFQVSLKAQSQHESRTYQNLTDPKHQSTLIEACAHDPFRESLATGCQGDTHEPRDTDIGHEEVPQRNPFGPYTT